MIFTAGFHCSSQSFCLFSLQLDSGVYHDRVWKLYRGVVDVKSVPFKEKNKLRLALLENGGNISYVINKEVRAHLV